MPGILAQQYQDEDAARAHLEKLLWPDGPVCPHCGLIDEAYKLEGETTRKGLYKCAGCRQPFTVTVGTIFEDSHIPLHKWLLAVHLMCSSKKGMSAHQLWRNLWGVNPDTGNPQGSYRTAWFMAHRIRWALGQEPIVSKLRGIVELDETWVGGKERYKPGEEKAQRQRTPEEMIGPSRSNVGKNPRENKTPVVSVLERSGDVRSRVVDHVTSENVKPILKEMVEQGSHIMTDSASTMKLQKHGWKHSSVDHHQKEYVRHEDGLTITTNSVEGFFSILKRGLNGVYHHVGKQYLDQYLREFDYRYNVRQMNDDARAVLALRKTSGKRLMLKTPKGTLLS